MVTVKEDICLYMLTSICTLGLATYYIITSLRTEKKTTITSLYDSFLRSGDSKAEVGRHFLSV
jgi:hypothetical protein